MTRRLEKFRNEFMAYCERDVLIADFDANENLVVFANPYRNFDEVIIDLCESLFDTVDFDEHLNIYLYQFGTNEYIRLGIN